MNEPTDQQLLRDFAERQSEAAFTALVHRYVDLVHSAALRLVNDAHAAKDVTQNVFVALAQNARQLTDHPTLAGWLHLTARNLAVKTIRADVRRRAREQEAAVMNELLSDSGTGVPPVWSDIASHLDDALAELSEPERDAVLLRYFQNHDLRTIGATLGISDDAAQKRVSRAVERLREIFAKRGVAVGAGGLAVVISANAVQAAPVGLALAISTAALTGTTLATTATIPTTKAIAMTALQKTIVTATIAVLAGAGIYEARQASTLRSQVQNLEQQQASLTGQIHQFQIEREGASQRIASLRDDIERLNQSTGELLKLRGEVTRLRNGAQAVAQMDNDPTVQLARTWKAKELKLRQLFEQKPDQRIPEMQFLNDEQWLDVAKTSDLDSTRGIRVAFSNIRAVATIAFAAKIQMALHTYMRASKNILPDSPLQLEKYFNPPVENAAVMLSRYEMLDQETQSKEGYKGASIIQKVLVDRIDNAHLIGVGMTGYAPRKGQDHAAVDYPRELLPVLKAYMDANNHTTPLDFDEYKPYITTPEQQAALDKFIKAMTE